MNSESSTKPGHRLWFLFGTGILTLGALVFVQLRPELEHNIKAWLNVLIILAGAVLSGIWFLLLSRISWRIRLLAVALGVAAIFTVRNTIRVDGTLSGTGLPRLAFRWTAPASTGQPRTIANSSVPATGTQAPGNAIHDVPQFFGPHRDGIVVGAHLSHDWAANPPKLLWRQTVGAGWSAFAVTGQQAFTQEQNGENELVTSYDLLTGRILWAHTNIAHFSQWQGGDGPRGTPAIDHGQIFTMGATGILDCLDAATGQKVWSREVLKENNLPNLIWGVSCSPLVEGDAVIVTGGLTNRATVLAYRRQTGEPLWQSGTDKASYASPTAATLGGQRLILSVNAGSLTGHEVKTGAVLLEYAFSNDKWPKASQPVVLPGDRIFLSAGYGVGCVMLQAKAEPSGKVTVTELWKNMAMKTQFNSAALRDGFIYGLDDGLLACVDASSGTRKWKDGRYGSGQSLLVDDALIIQSEPGAIILAAAKPESFAELGRIPALSSKTWNHPTLAGRYLLVRNDREAACYELPVQPSAQLAASQ